MTHKAKLTCECCGYEGLDVSHYPDCFTGTDFCFLCEECKEMLT